ncbi:MAG TPA: methyltransferase domain-containing protein [Burkholderiales bacterium]
MRFARFLRVKPICNAVFWLRFFWFVRLKRQVRVFEEKGGVRSHDYSLDVLLQGRTSARILRVIQPLTSIDRLGPDARVLSIGCRYETDLLYLVGYGLRAENVRGLDMISYSDWIDLGNMHDMRYPDDAWDAVLLGWVLSYSTEPAVAAREVVRVTRDGGLIAVGVSYYPPEVVRARVAEGKGNFGTGRNAPIQTTAEILELFRPWVDHVYYNHVPDPRGQGSSVAIFSIRKKPAR